MFLSLDVVQQGRGSYIQRWASGFRKDTVTRGFGVRGHEDARIGLGGDWLNKGCWTCRPRGLSKTGGTHTASRGAHLGRELALQ